MYIAGPTIPSTGGRAVFSRTYVNQHACICRYLEIPSCFCLFLDDFFAVDPIQPEKRWNLAKRIILKRNSQQCNFLPQISMIPGILGCLPLGDLIRMTQQNPFARISPCSRLSAFGIPNTENWRSTKSSVPGASLKALREISEQKTESKKGKGGGGDLKQSSDNMQIR